MRNKSDAIKIRNFLITAARILPYRFFFLLCLAVLITYIHVYMRAKKKWKYLINITKKKNVYVLSFVKLQQLYRKVYPSTYKYM